MTMARPERIGQALESIEAPIHYLVEGSEKPASYGGVRQSVADQQRKGQYKAHKMTIYNARAIAGQLSLEREGFAFVNHETKMKNFYDEDEVRDLYYKETEELVKRTSGAKRVVVFDHTLRSADEATREEKQISRPVLHAHNDYTDWSGPQRVRDLLPAEAEELLKRRFAIVQTWRPINKPVQREPLAIADARSIGTKELVASARIYPDRVGETAHMTSTPTMSGIISPICSAMKRLCSKPSSRKETAAPAGPPIVRSTTLQVRRTPRRGKASKCVPWHFSNHHAQR